MDSIGKGVDLTNINHPQKCNGFDVDHATCYRNFHCQKYNICLDHAIKHQWRSFSCKSCEKYFEDNENLDGEEKLEFYLIKYLIDSTRFLTQILKVRTLA